MPSGFPFQSFRESAATVVVEVCTVMAGDTEPIEILLHLPLLAEDKVRLAS